MPEPLTPSEISILALDTVRTPGHVGTVDVFDADEDALAPEQLVALVEERLSFVPRYRQRVRELPLRLAGPVWVDDVDFDLGFHLRRSALPRPGTPEQLCELVAQLMSRRLDRSRPLWEMYVVEGLAEHRFALVTKSHLALVDGVDHVDLGQVLLDGTPDAAVEAPAPWHPQPEPTGPELLAGALWRAGRDPAVAVENVRGAATGALGVAAAVAEALGAVDGARADLAGDALRGGRPPVRAPLAGVVSEQRRVATWSASLADLRTVRQEHHHTVHDVVLAVVAGALRSWLLTRGRSLPTGASLTALVPVSVPEDEGELTSLGSGVAPHVQRLPIGEPSALMRLHQVAYGTRAHQQSGRAVGARSLSDIAGFAPPTLHALGVRASADQGRRQHDLVITNVPGPQVPLYAAGSRLRASYPVIPLAAGHLLAVGVTSYDGQVFFGLTADRDAVPDLDVLARCLGEALAELLEATARVAATRQPPSEAETQPADAGQTPATKTATTKAATKRTATKKRVTTRGPSVKTPGAKAPSQRSPSPRPSGKKAAVTKAGAGSPTSASDPDGPGVRREREGR